MITTRRLLAMKPGDRIETTRVGNVRVVVERQADGLLRWLRETVDDAGNVVESLPLPPRRKKVGKDRRKPGPKKKGK